MPAADYSTLGHPVMPAADYSTLGHHFIPADDYSTMGHPVIPAADYITVLWDTLFYLQLIVHAISILFLSYGGWVPMDLKF